MSSPVEFARYGIKVAADQSTEAGQADFAADVSKIKAANPDAVFVYLNEEESARILKELKRQGVTAAADRRDDAGRPEGRRTRG